MPGSSTKHPDLECGGGKGKERLAEAILAIDVAISGLELDGAKCFDRTATLASMRQRKEVFEALFEGEVPGSTQPPNRLLRLIRDRAIHRRPEDAVLEHIPSTEIMKALLTRLKQPKLNNLKLLALLAVHEDMGMNKTHIAHELGISMRILRPDLSTGRKFREVLENPSLILNEKVANAGEEST